MITQLAIYNNKSRALYNYKYIIIKSKICFKTEFILF